MRTGWSYPITLCRGLYIEARRYRPTELLDISNHNLLARPIPLLLKTLLGTPPAEHHGGRNQHLDQ